MKTDADWPAVDRELKKKGNTLSLLWLGYKQENPDGMRTAVSVSIIASGKNPVA